MARQILTGTRAQDIPIEDARLVPIFDWRAVRRWDIDLVPPAVRDRTIRFRVPTAVGILSLLHHRHPVLVMAAQLLLIAATARRSAPDGAGPKRRFERREATLRASYERIRQPGRPADQRSGSGARRTSPAICTTTCASSWSACRLDVSMLKRSSGPMQDARAQQALSMVKRRTLGMVDDVRPSLTRFAPGHVCGSSASPRLAGSLHRSREAPRRSGQSQDGGRSRHHSTRRCATVPVSDRQEALRNGAVHGDARRLAVSIARSGEHIELTVSDDGRGFDLEAARQDGRGLGLVSMEERATWSAGRCRS